MQEYISEKEVQRAKGKQRAKQFSHKFQSYLLIFILMKM